MAQVRAERGWDWSANGGTNVLAGRKSYVAISGASCLTHVTLDLALTLEVCRVQVPNSFLLLYLL